MTSLSQGHQAMAGTQECEHFRWSPGNDGAANHCREGNVCRTSDACGVDLLTCPPRSSVQLESVELGVPAYAFPPWAIPGSFLLLFLLPFGKVLVAQFHLTAWSDNCSLSICVHLTPFISRFKPVDSLVYPNIAGVKGPTWSIGNYGSDKYLCFKLVLLIII